MTTTDMKEPATSVKQENEESVNYGKSSASAKKLGGRPDFVYDDRDKESFYKDLYSFHEGRNTPLARFPKVNGKEVDLHRLYSEVIKRGGWLKVNIRNEWDDLLPVLGIKQKCVNASVAIKYIYTRYLDKYEKLNFLGEDPDRVEEPDDEGRHHKKWSSSKTFHSVPMIYNYNQHMVPEPLRMLHRLSTDMYKGSEYDKLLLSLMSPLPNEQDFAINVCTLMANEGKHTLKIDHCPKLLDALMAHAGVFCHFTMRDLFVEMYTKIRRHSLQTFWTDCLYDKPQILELSYDDYFQAPDEKFANMGLCRPPLRLPFRETFDDGLTVDPEEYKNDVGRLDFLCLGRGLGTHDYIGQRVHQVISIIRNLSFFEENLQTLGKNRTFIRFLVMCSNVRWGNIHHMALDIFGNIAMQVDLCDPTSDDLTRCMLSTLCEGLEGQDRGVIISCLEILNKICQRDINEEYLHKCLDYKTYNQICLFLSLNDIMLLLYTLECIYALSSLGQRPCNALIQVKGIVDILVSLITVEAQSYGPDGCILMRVVETVPGNMLPMVAQNIANLQNAAMQGHVMATKKECHPEPVVGTAGNADVPKIPASATVVVATNPSASPPVRTIVQQLPKEPTASPPTPVSSKNIPNLQENESFAVSWLTGTFEQATSAASRVEQQELYKMYLSASQKSGRRGVVSPIHFPRIVRTVLGPTVGPNLIKTTESNGVELNAFYYVNIRVRANPMPVQNKGTTVQTQQPNQTQTNQKGATKNQQQKPQQQQIVEIEVTKKPEIAQKHKVSKKIQAQQQQQQLLQQQQCPITQPVQQQQPLNSIHPNSISNQQQIVVAQVQENQVPVTKIQTKNILINKNITAQHAVQQNAYQVSNNADVSHTAVIQQQQLPQQQSQQQQLQQQQQSATQVVVSANHHGNGNCPQTSSSLIKSLLANKVTTSPTATDVSETNASAAPNNPSCLITQNVNLHQVAQRQQLQKQKELAQQQQLQQQQQQQQQQNIQVPHATISALVNNPIIPASSVKVGQTTIKAITTNAVLPNSVIEKKPLQSTTDIVDNSHWDPVPPLAPLSGNMQSTKMSSTVIVAPANEDSNSTGNNSVASSAISSTQIVTTDDGEGSLISFEGLLVPKSKSGSSSVTEDEGSKDSFNKSAHMFQANQMLVDLLDKKSPDPPVSTTVKRKLEDDFTNENDNNRKRLAVDNTTEEIYEEEMPIVHASKNAANFYAEMAASILEDEDLDDEPEIVQSIPVIQPPVEQKQVITMPMPMQRQIIMAPNNQMILTQPGQVNQSVQAQATATIKTDSGLQTVPLIIQKQIGPNGQQIIQPVIQQAQPQTQYVLATNPQGQTYLVAQQQSQPTLNQTLLLAQTGQQQGTPTKTIIILQQQGGTHQAVAQQQLITNPGGSQKVIMTTQQGQQMIVTQVPRPMQHHQIIMNHPTTNIIQNCTSQNVILTQTAPVVQQSQIPQHIQIQAPGHQQQIQIHSAGHTAIQKQIQLQQQVGSVQMQTAQQVVQQQAAQQQAAQQQAAQQQAVQQQAAQQQAAIQAQAAQQQASLLSQLPHIPATIKIHQHQSVMQTQTTQTQTTPKQQSKQAAMIQQQTTLPLVSQQTVIQPPQTQARMQDVKGQIIIAGNGRLELSEHPKRGPTPTPPVNAPTPPVLQQQPIPVKHSKVIVDLQTDEELIDQNWLWICDWRGCPRKQFKSMAEVYRHACTVHCPENLDSAAEIYCQWGPGTGLCDNIPRKRYSLMTHLLDRHCTMESFKAAVQRRLVTGIQPPQHGQPVTIIKNANADARGTSSPTLSTSSNSSLPAAASAAMHAIKRHSNDFINPKELMDENEGPVTKSIRLTAALILRNLVSHTALAKRNVRYFEPHLAGVALSNVESSRTISQILFELNN